MLLQYLLQIKQLENNTKYRRTFELASSETTLRYFFYKVLFEKINIFSTLKKSSLKIKYYGFTPYWSTK